MFEPVPSKETDMLDQGLIEEFQLDWKLAGKAASATQVYTC